MKRGASPPKFRRARARSVLVQFVWALLLLGAAPAYLWLALNYSGELALAQKAPAAAALRGFDFGPVYLQQGVRQRYFISTTIPHDTGGAWQTRFEVLDSQRQPVFKQDELRFIGDYQFEPGQRTRMAKAFTLDAATGYYYFRFTALNGSYAANPQTPPVVEFAVRQRVADGYGLWLPAGLLALAAAGWLMALWLTVSRLGADAGAAAPSRRTQRGSAAPLAAAPGVPGGRRSPRPVRGKSSGSAGAS